MHRPFGHNKTTVTAHVDLVAVERFPVTDLLGFVVPAEVVVPSPFGASCVDRVGGGQDDPVDLTPAAQFALLVFIKNNETGGAARDSDVAQPAVLAPLHLDHLRGVDDRPGSPLHCRVLATLAVAWGVGAVFSDAAGLAGVVDGEHMPFATAQLKGFGE